MYGGDNADDWLHTTEGLVERYKLQTKPMQSLEQTTSEVVEMHKKSGEFNAGQNNTFNFVSGDQTHSQVGHSNTQNNHENVKPLVEQLDQLLLMLEKGVAVDDDQSVQITQAANQIKTEIQKPEAANKTILVKSKQILEGVKNIASISASIEKIIQLLQPWIS